jgi:hypothetical protein
MVVAARRIEKGVARGASRVGVEISVDGELGAAVAAEDGLMVPFGVGPWLDGVVGQGFVAVFAGVIDSAAFHFDGNDVERRTVMKAAGLGIKIQATNFGSSRRHGGSRV